MSSQLTHPWPSRPARRSPSDGESDGAKDLPPVWQLHEFAEVDSTNLVAAKLPAWHAVRADCQTAGRGRFQRAWVSNRGGLWLSAVVPIIDKSPQARLLPLAAGLAVSEALRVLHQISVRLRWPNDILVGPRKLAG